MKAAQITAFGHTDVIKINEVKKPRPAEGQVLIEMHASSINPIDSALRKGLLEKFSPVKLPATLGIDAAGIVADTGKGVFHLEAGDKVYGNAGIFEGGSGAFAEYATAPANSISLMPNNITFTEAAAIMLVGLSAREAISEHMKLKTGQKILIHGGSGGIGSIAIQLAKHIGAHVAVTGTAIGIEHAKQSGADVTIDYETQRFEDMIGEFDAVLDTVGNESYKRISSLSKTFQPAKPSQPAPVSEETWANTYKRSFKVLKKGGIIVSMVEQPDKELMDKYQVNAIFQMTHTSSAALDALTNLIEDNMISVFIEETYSLDEAVEAFETKEAGHVRGKIAIEIKKT